MAEPGPGARAAVRLLVGAGQTVAVAESLTGGMASSALVDVPGASAAFRGGVVAYATRLKHDLLGVDEGLLSRSGPVDPDVAVQMAEGVARRLGADWGCATTGVAGPDPQDGKAVGTVFVAVCGPDVRQVRSLSLGGDRDAVRLGATASVLGLLVQLLEQASTVAGQDPVIM